MNRWMRGLLGVSVCMILGISQAYAVALGKIEVASHLGETFFAEVPMQLEENESIASVFVEVAAPTDYRILEIYRDPALNAVRSDVKKDSRGTRVELSSDSVIDAPFFNLILKVRHGHATHFKKYPVFLDLPQARPVQTKALPTVSAIHPQANAGQQAQPETSESISLPTGEPETEASTASAFKPHDGWARTDRYGPMVYGDTISTVARRLRVDERYTMPQVMMALFNKNKKKFSQGNVNLINAGTYLDVPQASEVEELTPSQARSVLAQHNRSWSELKKQPRYAAVADAQKNRYKTRVRVGKGANGVASAPVPGTETREKTGTETDQGKTAGSGPSATTGAPETVTPDAMQQAKLDAVQQENAALQEKLNAAEDKISALSGKLASADVVAANARIKKLELSLARLQAELDQSRQEAKSGGGASPWLTYLLGGLVIVLLAGVGYLLRRERPHPAIASTTASTAAVESAQAPPLEDEVQEFEEVTQEAPAAEEEPAEEPGQATMQMNTQEFEDAFTDSVPDLTESDTAEMEALQEAVEEEPDPNVDYMAEADVYLRYGMEDEAIGQIRMAIKQQPNNADAHGKLVQVLQSKGDQAALDEAIEAGRTTLGGEGLQAFEALVSTAGKGEDEVDLSDTLPPTGIEAIDFSETEVSEAGESATEKSADEGQDTLVLGEEIDIAEIESSEDQGEQTEENTVAEEAPLSDETTIGREEAEVTVTEESGEESASGDEAGEQQETEGESEDILEMNDLDMGDLDWDTQSTAGEEDEQATVVETALETVVETFDVTEPGIDTGEAAESEGATETSSTEETTPSPEEMPEADLDLTGIDLPDVGDVTGGAVASSDMETSDLEKTIAIDWSGDTEALEEMTGGFSAKTEEPKSKPSGESGEVVAGEDSGGAQEETKESAEKPFNPQSSGVLDIGLNEIEVNEAEPPSSDDEDEFTSTVQMTVDVDEAEELPDIGLESVELEVPGAEEAEEAETDDALADIHLETEEASAETDTLEPGLEDANITSELDGLLTELDTDTSVDSLNIDKARSLLAEGELDEAESLFKSAADAGDKRCDGLLGLAEVAQQKGDASGAAELLAEAEALVGESNRDWFESIKSKQD